MTSLLVLLGLLSVATIAARRGRFGELVGGAATPVLVLAGVAVGPRGLGFLTPSVVSGLAPALDVAICWLGFIAGLRAGAPIAHERPDRRALLPLLNAMLAAAVVQAFASSGLWALDGAALPVAALLAGACLGAPASTGSDARFAKIVALVAAALALSLASPASLAVVLGLGSVAALVVLLAGGHDASGTLIAVIGAVTLVAGLSGIAGAPALLAGVAAGAILARSSAGRALWPLAERSERPVRIVVTVVVAASAGVDTGAAALGAALAVVALLAGALTLGPSHAARTGALASSSLALALVASLAAAGTAPTLLAPLLVAIALVDAVAMALGLATRLRRGEGP